MSPYFSRINFSPINIKRWIEENRHLFEPPFKTNRVIAHDNDFIVMVLHGPNLRLDFHVEPGEELFYQISGDIEVHFKPENERRQIVKVREGELFLCPGGLAHSPRRGEGTWGLVIERKRKPDENEEFAWFCERCDERVLARTVIQGEVAAQVSEIYAAFNADPVARTCKSCGYMFPATPMAERLGFLGPS
jgi:3-hydroxyanthranilate 3,4-dioxygenase